MWDVNSTIFLLILSTLGIIWIIGYVLILSNRVVYIDKGRKRHNWKFIAILDRSCFCSICEILIPPSVGLFCDFCGVCSHNSACLKLADRKFRCKEFLVEKSDSIKHHWIKGNLPLNCECSVCHADIDYHTQPGLYGLRCCWCQRCVHNKCTAKVPPEEQCDFGEFRDMIVPPYSIIPARTRSAPKLHLEGIKLPTKSLSNVDWKPLIVIANVKSGSSSASDILSLFRGLLNPLQVMEMSSFGPGDALQWALKIKPFRLRILVAGGDGTVGWVLNTIKKMNIDPVPEVAILPLGTGNDLSRVMGWGATPPDSLDPIEYLRKIQRCTPISLDRWLIKITGSPYRFPIKRSKHRTFFVYNYFSVGVDAQVTLNFHKARESSFYLLSSRIINKLLYLCFGTHQVVQQDCAGLDTAVEVYLDDRRLELPELQSVVCLNIDSWGAGVKLFEMSQTTEDKRIHSVDDGQLEIFGVVSSFHIAQLQVGLSKPIRLGQTHKVKIILHRAFPVQADGEPWIQKPCEINIEKCDQALMLRNETNSPSSNM